MEGRIDRALRALQSKGFVKPCDDPCCRQCNPSGYASAAANGSSSGAAAAAARRPSKFTRIQPYPSECVAARAAAAANCKPRAVNRHVLATRLRRTPNAFHYFAAYKPRGVTSMRKLGGGGFGKVCRDFVREQKRLQGGHAAPTADDAGGRGGGGAASGAAGGGNSKARGCAFGSSCRFQHPGTFQVQSVYVVA